MVRWLVYISKGLLTTFVLYVAIITGRNKPFYRDQSTGAVLFNAIIPLFILMNLASPVVWVHHGIFLTLSFLLLIKGMDTPGMWLWFGLAYLLEFLLPTFDFYPWSYGRLVAPLICLGLIWGITYRGVPSSFFERLNRELEVYPLPFESRT